MSVWHTVNVSYVLTMFYELNCVPKIHVLKNQWPSTTVFGDGAFREIIKLEWDYKGGALIQKYLCPYKKKHQGSLFRSPSVHREEAMWEHKKVVLYKTGRE